MRQFSAITEILKSVLINMMECVYKTCDMSVSSSFLAIFNKFNCYINNFL